MKMRSRRQIERDRAKRDPRRRVRSIEDDKSESDMAEPLDESVARSILGYDE